MEASTFILIIVIAVLALVLIAVLLAARRRGSWVNDRRRGAAASSHDEAVGIDMAARTHDAEADELAARAQHDRADAQEREVQARRLRLQGPDVDHKADTANEQLLDAKGRRRDPDGPGHP